MSLSVGGSYNYYNRYQNFKQAAANNKTAENNPEKEKKANNNDKFYLIIGIAGG